MGVVWRGDGFGQILCLFSSLSGKEIKIEKNCLLTTMLVKVIPGYSCYAYDILHWQKREVEPPRQNSLFATKKSLLKKNGVESPFGKAKICEKKGNLKIEEKLHAILYWQSMELSPPLAKQNIWFSFRYKHASLQLESVTKLWSCKVPDQCFFLSCFHTW